MSTLRTINVIHPSGSTTNIVNDSSGNVTVGNDLTVTGALVPSSSFKRNRIINGNMLIDQRNAGAAVTVNSSSNNTFSVDRWQGAGETTDGVFTLQQSSSVAPTGFITSMLATVTTADTSIGATQRYFVQQRIEGYNTADLGWGAAGALSVTLSFWVRSSLTGTFGGSIRNSAGDRSYPFSYTISAANTWEQKSVTIAGDTTGTWVKDSGIGMMVTWGLGVGSSLSGTAGAWSASGLWSATGAVNVIATNGATFYLTGVQLEVGTKATPYEMQIVSDQLAQCQRYYQTQYLFQSSSGIWLSYYGGSSAYSPNFLLPVVMRATPTATLNTSSAEYYSYAGVWTATTISLGSLGPSWFYAYAATDGDGRGKLLRTGSGGTGPIPYGIFSAEL